MDHFFNIMKSSTPTQPAGEKFSMATRRLLLSALFLTGAALIPLQANAAAAGASSTNVDQVVNSAARWTVLRTVSFINFPLKARNCIATGSSDALNPNNDGLAEYVFTLSLDNPNPALDSGFERTLNFLNTFQIDVADNRIKEITSTGGVFRTGGRFHTIYWLARKVGLATPNLTVDDSSLSVVCTEEGLQGLAPFPQLN